ncbi:carbon-nitrogen hydrolase family protein [Parafrigoribacterium soli]|uniref:carbon-nitrogen hydrolase family protein n=1 Tax=Parafrigoribacterium soli TaxID=3144663 RepID=UPI0032F058F9
MPRNIRIAAVQAQPLPIGAPLDAFAADLDRVLEGSGGATLVVYPELHLFGSEEEAPDRRNDLLRRSAAPLDGPLVAGLGAIARNAGVWLVPGSVCELGPGGELFNTALVFSPQGDLVASYRKIFPWRPYEPYDPGDRFVVFDIEGVGRFGLSICYDSWFPEVSRHLGWMGAEAVLNIVKTTTPDRAQELVLARANSIVNQTFTVSVNCAGPVGKGQSLIVAPDGAVLREVADDHASVIVETIDLDAVSHIHEHGTAGLNRMWDQFLPTDAALELPLYGGRIEPARWNPSTSHQPNTSTGQDTSK